MARDSETPSVSADLPASEGGTPFSVQLWQYRTERGWTQEELAERAGLSPRGIRALEQGERDRPYKHTVRQLADALGLSGEARELFETAARRSSPPARDRAADGVRTFLFADVRGYTRFTVEHGDEAAARLATKFAALARETVAARGGEVIELRGDEALAVFSSARQALRAALDLQARFAAETESEPDLPLPAGIGLDAGEAIPVEGGYRGTALNLAARLCSLAGPGEVLASEGVTHLARKTEGLSYVERGPVQIKGFVEPVKVVQIVSESQRAEGTVAVQDLAPPAAETALPIGAFLGSLPSGPMVARDEELAAIQAAVDSAAEGTGQLLTLGGQRGIGKTRLAQEATLTAHKRGFLIATGRCYQQEQSVPFFPFLEALGMAYTSAPSTIRFQVPRRWPHLAALLPDQLTTPTPDPSIDPQEEQQRVIRAVTGFVGAIAQERPVALLLDDLHWADEASLRLLAHLARQMRGRRVLLLGTYRDTELSREPALERTLRELTRERLVERITVRRLPAEGTAAMVAATIGDMETTEEFTEFVHRRTKGVPFFVDELLRSLGGHYRLIREIGAGGMGRVFEAVDTRTGEPVAAKIMFASKEATADAALRFEQEGAVLATLQHPNIVEVYGTFMQEHASFIVMELLEGRSLADILRSEQLELGRIKRIAQQVASALASAHHRGIVHRDIKPDNIMVLGEDQVKVTDFGIARVLRPEATIHTMTSTGMTLGTPLYMSPEQIDGRKADGRADVYSLGAVLYQMVTGRPPFEAADPLTIAFKHVNEEPAPPRKVRAGVPRDWEALILKALAKNPADRYQTVGAMEAAIAELSTESDGKLAAIGPSAAREEAPTPRRSLLRVLTPPPRAPVRAERAANGSALPLPEAQADKVTALRAVELGPLIRIRREALSRPLLAGVGALIVVALVAVLLLNISRSSGTSAEGAPLATWGTQSSQAGKFSAPYGIAVDSAGDVYVADQIGNFVQKLSPAGLPLARWGSSGKGPGQFSGPAGVALDRQGNVYVADFGNNRIEELSPSGTFVREWGPDTGVQLSSPLSVAVDGKGNIYVDDTPNGGGRVQELSPGGRVLLQVRTGLRYPDGLAVDGQGNIYVADAGNNDVLKLSAKGTKLARWAPAGTNPTGLALDRKANIYITDQLAGTILKLSSKGETLASFGAKGSGADQLQSPQALAVDGVGHIYVADTNNHRVQQLTSTGHSLARWTATGRAVLHFQQPTGVAVDPSGSSPGIYLTDNATHGSVYKLTADGLADPRWRAPRLGSGPFGYVGVAADRQGHVYVVDQLNGIVLKLSSTGKVMARWSSPINATNANFNNPSGVAVDARGNVYVADGADKVVELTSDGASRKEWGSPGANVGQFSSPSGVAVDPHGNLYVADSTNDTVQEFSPGGDVVAHWGSAGRGEGQLKGPAALALDAPGNVYVADTGNSRIEEFSSDGKFIRQWGTKGTQPGQLSSPAGIALDSGGNVYVADTDNHRVQKFPPAG